MANFIFTRRFLQDVTDWEKGVSPRDRDALERLLGAIAADPALPGRTQSYYDPGTPSYLYRAGALLVHYRLTPDGQVEFLNLFY